MSDVSAVAYIKQDKLMINRAIMVLFAAALLIVAGTGCHTARGFGEDMSAAGDKIQEKTDK